MPTVDAAASNGAPGGSLNGGGGSFDDDSTGAQAAMGTSASVAHLAGLEAEARMLKDLRRRTSDRFATGVPAHVPAHGSASGGSRSSRRGGGGGAAPAHLHGDGDNDAARAAASIDDREDSARDGETADDDGLADDGGGEGSPLPPPLPPLFAVTAPLVRMGMMNVVDDSFTRCFKSQKRVPWNWNCYLWPTWAAGLVLRYAVLFPLRVLALALGFLSIILVMPVVKVVAVFVDTTTFETALIQLFASSFVASWSGVVRIHGLRPTPRPGQPAGVFVANHSSMIDFILLLQSHPYAVVGQKHPGWVGMLQDHVLGSLECVWFNRGEAKDRKVVTERLKAHAHNPRKADTPLLVFPEGTCVNNEYVVQFKKGVFELGVPINPVAIKYNKVFVDGYWNSREQSFAQHLFRLMTSWAVVVDIWFMDQQTLRPGETPAEFARRVQRLIAARAGLKAVDWDGYMKYWKPSARFIERQQRLVAEQLCTELGLNFADVAAPASPSSSSHGAGVGKDGGAQMEEEAPGGVGASAGAGATVAAPDGGAHGVRAGPPSAVPSPRAAASSLALDAAAAAAAAAGGSDALHPPAAMARADSRSSRHDFGGRAGNAGSGVAQDGGYEDETAGQRVGAWSRIGSVHMGRASSSLEAVYRDAAGIPDGDRSSFHYRTSRGVDNSGYSRSSHGNVGTPSSVLSGSGSGSRAVAGVGRGGSSVISGTAGAGGPGLVAFSPSRGSRASAVSASRGGGGSSSTSSLGGSPMHYGGGGGSVASGSGGGRPRTGTHGSNVTSSLLSSAASTTPRIRNTQPLVGEGFASFPDGDAIAYHSRHRGASADPDDEEEDEEEERERVAAARRQALSQNAAAAAAAKAGAGGSGSRAIRGSHADSRGDGGSEVSGGARGTGVREGALRGMAAASALAAAAEQVAARASPLPLPDPPTMATTSEEPLHSVICEGPLHSVIREKQPQPLPLPVASDAATDHRGATEVGASTDREQAGATSAALFSSAAVVEDGAPSTDSELPPGPDGAAAEEGAPPRVEVLHSVSEPSEPGAGTGFKPAGVTVHDLGLEGDDGVTEGSAGADSASPNASSAVRQRRRGRRD